MKTNHNTISIITAAISRFVRATRRGTRPLLAALASLAIGHSGALHAQLPAAHPFVPRIVEISPSQAMVGQAITVRTAPSAYASFIQQQRQQLNLSIIRPFPNHTVTPNPNPQPPRIYFADASGQPTIEGSGVTSLGNNWYRVTVPQNARSGQLRFQTLTGSSYSTVNLTVVSAGYSIVNFSQFDVVSVKVDNIERLAPQEIAATLPTNPNVFVADIGTTAGNHSVQVTLGPSVSQPVIVYSLPSVAATNPTTEIQVGIMAAGEYLTASPNATVSGNNITASWQTFVVNADPSLSSVNGFDFTFNTATGAITWINWNGDRPNVVASGTVAEPASWPLNPASVTLALRRTNGTLWTNAVVNLLNKSFVAADGNTYELQ